MQHKCWERKWGQGGGGRGFAVMCFRSLSTSTEVLFIRLKSNNYAAAGKKTRKKQWGNINIDSGYSRRQRYRPGQSERVEEREGGGERENGMRCNSCN